MKKIIVFVMTISLLFGMTVFADNILSTDGIYGYSKDGTLNYYYGEEYVYVPGDIDGTYIVKIGEQAFFDLGILDVFLDEGIEVIGKSAFEGCNTESVALPESLKIIEAGAFQNCASLSDVFFYGSSDIAIGEEAFSGTGHITFYIMCTENSSNFYEKIKNAKGDDNFSFEVLHSDMQEIEYEKDIFGANMLYCNNCQAKESRYFNDTEIPFNDVPENAWYYPYVAFAYCSGIVNGKGEQVFDPDGGMTCAEAAKIAALIHESQLTGNGIETYGEKWYDAYVDYCYKEGIIEDYITFDWESLITRGQMAYLFSRCDAYTFYLNEVPITDIPDVYDTTPYAYEILDLYDKGIAVGDKDMSFYPDSAVKRSEASALITRILAWELRIELPKG